MISKSLVQFDTCPIALAAYKKLHGVRRHVCQRGLSPIKSSKVTNKERTRIAGLKVSRDCMEAQKCHSLEGA